MNKTKKKLNDNKKTKKNKINLTNVSIKYYSLNYKNTQLLPKTQIMNYLTNNFKIYLEHSNTTNSSGNFPLIFEDCFIVNNDDFPIGLKKNEINKQFKMNPKTSLDKFISYCFYIKTPNFFREKTQKETIELIKYQIGKDVSRDDRNINNKEYNKDYYLKNGSNNYEIADLFYQNIMDYLYAVKKNINLDIVNKFALISCQNVYGLITDLITVKLNDVLNPETNTVFRPDKHIDITINNQQITMELFFESKLIISRNGDLDPEYPCGELKFILSIDLLNNLYELKEFILNYDINKCGPEIKETQQPTEDTSGTTFKPQYIIPALLVSGGLIATPFVLPLLGGKTVKNKKKTKCVKSRKKLLNK